MHIKQYIPGILLLFCQGWVAAQQVELSFPSLPDRSAVIYYTKGHQLDSLLLVLDSKGKTTTHLPTGYKGFIQLSISGSGVVECIGGEPLLSIESDASHIEKDNVRFPDSNENNFFYRLLDEQSLNAGRRSWVQFGKQLYPQGTDVYKMLEQEEPSIEQQASAIAKQIADTDLYASRLMRLIAFTQEMYTALNHPEASAIQKIKDYLHQAMDWETLYTAGQFWGLIQEYYIHLFDLENPSLSLIEKEMRYAADLSSLFGQVQEPVRSSLLETTYSECEKIGWDAAKDSILSYILTNGIAIEARNGNLKRILSAYKTKPGAPAPEIKGLAGGLPQGISIVLFYESGCANCQTQLEELSRQYAYLHDSGIQVISIAADLDERVFNFHAQSFPWSDKLCDYKGFMGENFVNYAILATPMFYVIGKGIILGRYASLSDTKLLQQR
ncbi:MAG: redoxin domain-containing protein [Dysgonamonadaceae bacterium]|nr:redoxin domain-containing protein [Dysgonamonadaceae bacterium]